MGRAVPRSRSTGSPSPPSAPVASLLGIDRSADPLAVALGMVHQGISVYDRDQRLVFFNRRYAEIYGIDPARLRLGMSLAEAIELRYESGTVPSTNEAAYRAWMSRLLDAGQAAEAEFSLSNGVVVQLSHQPLPDGGFIGFLTDNTARHRAERRIEHMALHDALTLLPNRTHFVERLGRSVDWFRGDPAPTDQRPPRTAADGMIGLILLDLDGFKDVNDALGHHAGDELLQRVAERLRECLRVTDFLARLDGDRFAILLDTGVADDAQVEAVGRRLLDALGRPFVAKRSEVTIGASIGFTSLDDGARTATADSLLTQSDMALNHAKAQGRGGLCRFEPAIELAIARRTDLERELRRAVAAEALTVFFQPIYRLAPLRLVGAEALLRWNHTQFGPISPAEFIPMAEASGLITVLGRWVLRQACAQAARWGNLTIAVNLSPEQVRQPDLIALVKEVLAETGLPPERLELEITEGMLLHDKETTVDKLRQLRALGIGIALDDFGTGYSSLSYLHRFPFSKIKIDRSFIEHSETDAGTAAIVGAIATLGRSLAMSVIAEGIETERQLEQIRSVGCDEAQGFLLGRPCAADVFARAHLA